MIIIFQKHQESPAKKKQLSHKQQQFTEIMIISFNDDVGENENKISLTLFNKTISMFVWYINIYWRQVVGL